MPSYYLSENQTNGVYEIHAEGCVHLPDRYHRLYLGEYPNGRLALKKAALLCSNVKVCSECGVPELAYPQPFLVHQAS
ncbi:hypothetical protein [Hoeflea poritis]|uniref:Uncharacterized protein n=1 Tax=Hoeflea poritis TaxID=2993659 RepID=A0ABT4VTN8_9HYPH|nr:hypothetical protein [Hoeflea poritis]MDA4848072.1 hypothetical protein [Hoeflea poritis]